MFVFRADLTSHLREEDVRTFSESLAGRGHIISIARETPRHDAVWVLKYFTPDPSSLPAFLQDAALPPAWTIKLAPENFARSEMDDATDWLAASYRQFPPFSVGPFFIYGSHYTDKIPADKISLQIDAATAFGSGEHGTTRGCLLAMLDLKEQGACPWNILDMGTGSGILAIAAYKLWKTPVLAVDNDAEAVRVSDHHAMMNKIPAGKTDYSSAAGNGFNASIVQERKPFDLVVANILASALKDMAGALKAVTDDNGYVILSGILIEQADDVIKAYAPFTLKKRYDIGEWSTLLLQK